MPRKDVDLVIRAKDEAESVVKSITKALNEFIGAQQGVSSEAGETSSALAKLGASIKTIEKVLGTADIGKKLSADLDDAAAAVVRLESNVASSRKEFLDMRRDARQLSGEITKLGQQIDASNKSIVDQKAAISKTKADLAAYEKGVKETAAAQERLAKRQADLPGLIEKQTAALAKATTRYDGLQAKVAETGKVTQSTSDKLASSGNNVQRLTKIVADLTAEYANNTAKATQLTASGTDFAAKAAASAGSLKVQEAALVGIVAELEQLTVKAKSAGAAQVDLERGISRVAQRLLASRREVEKAREGYDQLAISAGAFDKAVSAGATAAQGNLDQQFVDQAIAVRAAREQFEKLNATAEFWREEAGRVGVPTRELSQQVALAGQKANEAHLKFLVMEESLSRLGQVMREAGSDSASLANAQSRFSAEQEKLSASMAEVANDGLRERNAIRDIHKESEQATGSVRRLAGANDALGQSARRAAGETTKIGQAYRQINGDTRTTLNLTQRLRGQVLALIAAYGGLYGVVNVLGQVVGAYQTLEGAQARLNVANSGDIRQSAEDLDFLRRNANRLGIDMGTLATEFSKFSIATKDTNLEGEKTRKIFLAVAEAARVNRSSNEEMQGVFTALTQIVSKGAVQMEELRQQLGDRLPGALQIMADGLGVTTAELIKMMEQGEVTADALVPFAEELNKRFGPGLAEALSGVTVSLGRLKNAAFQALVIFGKAGFLDAFKDLTDAVTRFLQSADFESFAAKLSSAFSVLLKFLEVCINNFDLLVVVATTFLSLQLASVFVRIARSVGAFATGLKAAAVGMAGMRTAAVAAQGAAVAAGAAGTAATGVLATLGGPITLAVAAIATGIGLWLTATNDATEALHTHRELLDKVKDGYDAVGGSAERWRDTVNDITAQEALDNERAAFEQLEGTINRIFAALETAGQSVFAQGIPGAKLFVGASNEYIAAVKELLRRVGDGEVSVFQFREELDKLANTYRDGSAANNRLASQLDKLGAELEQNGLTLQQTQRIVALVTGELTEAQTAFDDLGNKAKESGDKLEEAFNGALGTLSETVAKIKEDLPDTISEQDKMTTLVGELRKNYEEALAAARQIPDALKRAQAEQSVLNGMAEGMKAIWETAKGFIDSTYTGFTDGTSAAAQFIMDEEGFRADPYYDVNAFRAGFGSDTVTLADGSIQRVTEGMRVTLEDANRDLQRRLETEFIPAWVSAIGQARFDQLSPQQVAALASLAYNYGAGEVSDTGDLRQVVAALRDGTEASVAAAIRSLGSGGHAGTSTGDVLTARRAREAALFESRASDDAQVREANREREEAERERQREREATAERLASGEEEVRQQELINAGKGREAAIEAAVAAAQKENKNITAEEIAQVKEHAGRLYDLQQIKKGTNAETEKAEQAEERVNLLLEKRNALQEQLELAQSSGDTALAEELRGKVAEVNAELLAAIANAKAMWEAVGGEEAATKAATLDTAAAKARQFGQQAVENYFSWKKVGDLFLNGLASAFDRFSQAVAEGKGIGEAARDAFLQFAADFLREIAQMIIKQAIFNALSGTRIGGFLGIGTGHTGGLVGSKRIGSGNSTRRVHPGIFAAAARFHGGGIVGLAPNEVPAILKRGEEVLTADDPRHMLNGGAGGGGGATAGGTKIVNAIDAPSFLAAALQSEIGEKVLLNWIKANSDAVNSARG